MKLKCVFSVDKNRDHLYTCEITVCNIESRNTVIETLKGQHKRTKDNKSVKGLCFHDTKVHFIPRNLSEMFPNLNRLEIERCELREVSAEDLVGLDQLEAFYVGGNKITTLSVNLFKNMPKLKVARFNENLLTSFDVQILEPIKNTIELFDISDNTEVNEIFDKENENIEHFIKRMRLLETKKKRRKSCMRCWY